jgi:hypothetical protein
MAKPLMRSFAGGEITPELFGRIDLNKFQTGLARALNFRVLPHGPAQNRAGFQYVLTTRVDDLDSRVIPFTWSVDQTMVLEFGDFYVRFHTQGGTLLETGLAIAAITQANPGVLTYTGSDPTSNDWVYLSDIGGMAGLNGRYVKAANVNAGANTFELHDLDGNSIDTTTLPAYTAGGTAARVYTLATNYAAAEVFDLHYTQSADVLTLVHPSHPVRELRRLGAANWALTDVTFGPGIVAPGGPPAATPTGTGAITYDYVVTAVSAANFEESVASANASCVNDLTVAGQFNTITWAAVAGAIRYNVYKRRNGLYGYIGQTASLTFDDDNITQDLTTTPPEANDPFGSAGNYPSTVTYVEQRRGFAATDNNPQTGWLTRSATESNMTQSVPTRDSDAIVFTVKANQQNRIRHLVPLGDLIALTVGSEFRIFADGGGALTPANVTPKPQSYGGASNVQPMVAESSILYEQSQGGHIREFAYAGEGLNGALYRSNDVSILAPHLFDGHVMVDMAFSRTAACPILWVVRDDGVLLGLTYVPGQEVRAWHQHTTDGLFKSVACVSEGGEDVLYVVVERTIGGVAKRFVERLHTRAFTALADAFFVDSGLTYSGAATDVLTGLWHLEGKTVVTLVNGAVIRDLVVTGGQVTLPAGVTTTLAHVGLPYTCNLRTLPLSWQADGFGQGAVKNVSRVSMRLSQSSGVHVGPADGVLTEVKQRMNEPYGSPPALMTGWKHTNITPRWEDDGGIEVEQTGPLPVTVLAVVLDTVSGG